MKKTKYCNHNDRQKIYYKQILNRKCVGSLFISNPSTYIHKRNRASRTWCCIAQYFRGGERMGILKSPTDWAKGTPWVDHRHSVNNSSQTERKKSLDRLFYLRWQLRSIPWPSWGSGHRELCYLSERAVSLTKFMHHGSHLHHQLEKMFRWQFVLP